MNSKLSSYFLKKYEFLIEKQVITRESWIKFFLNSSFVAGGAVTSLLNNNEPNDIDIFFRNSDHLQSFFKVIAGLAPSLSNLDLEITVDSKNPRLKRGGLVKKETSTSKRTVEELIDATNETISSNSCIKFVSLNAITFKNGLQLIFRFIGEPEEVFTTFDYDHCKVYWQPQPTGRTEGVVTITPEAQAAISTNKLVYSKRSRFIVSAIYRLVKFAKRGWTVPLGTVLSLVDDLQAIDLKEPKVLKEELLGFYGVKLETMRQLLTDVLDPTTKKINKKLLLEEIEKL